MVLLSVVMDFERIYCIIVSFIKFFFRERCCLTAPVIHRRRCTIHSLSSHTVGTEVHCQLCASLVSSGAEGSGKWVWVLSWNSACSRLVISCTH